VNLDEAMKEDSDQEADLVRISGKTVRISGTHKPDTSDAIHGAEPPAGVGERLGRGGASK
jgi:hypothetical protein